MRLTRRYLLDIPTFVLEVQDSDYIGTESVQKPQGHIRGRIAPVTDKLNYELYGERITAMKQLTTADALEVGMVCEVGGVRYRVISLNQYSAHATAILEALTP